MLIRRTKLAKRLDAAKDSINVQYDQNVKELLADEQILSRIVKYSLEEFADISLEEIENGIKNVCCKPVEPGLTNVRKFRKLPTESKIQNEGEIYFDILFEVECNDIDYNMIINVEAQKSDEPTSLGYHIENRGTVYLGRLLSSQVGENITNSKYDNLKKVKSIWICMNCEEDSIIKYTWDTEVIWGSLEDIPYDLPKGQIEMVVIRLRNNKNVEISKNELVSVLEDLLRTDDTLEEKKENAEKHGIKMTEKIGKKVSEVCNLSEAVEEKGIKIGEKRGVIKYLLRENEPIEKIMEKTGESEKTIEAIREEMKMNKQ